MRYERQPTRGCDNRVVAIDVRANRRLVEVGTDFQATPLEVLAGARLSDAGVPAVLRRLADNGIAEVALLSTCNRFELYAASEDPEETITALVAELHGVLGGNGHVETVVRREGDAVGHLIAVAAGLESALLGEHEILGQVRRARATAVDVGTAGADLDRLFEHALRHGRRIRRALGISNLRRSLTDLAADWLSTQITEPALRAAVVVGAGETAAQMASHLRALGIGTLTVANRSQARSRELADSVGGNPERLDRLPALLPTTDLVVLATSAAEAVLSAADVRDALHGRSDPLLVVDLGLSPNAEPGVARHPLVTTLTLSDVVSLAFAESERERTRTAHAHALVQGAVDAFSAATLAQDRSSARAASTV